MSQSGTADNEDEILDVIDENDNVIGQLPKKAVHAGKNIMHREISVLVYYKNNELLLQQRSWKKKYFPGVWSITTAGHVLSGQTPEDAAHMELKEELGFDTKLSFAEKRKYITGDHISLGFFFIGKFPEGTEIIQDKDELENAGFFSSADVKKMIENSLLDPHSAKTINRYLSGDYNQTNDQPSSRSNS